ncbi:hypothetical protein [Corynebacterium appendicis]|uniref:hypothetical protein n=1 Tax=Corynebacterium appendicis TaxID=163202 RepID=UPI00254CACF9|nr:hypothetical protein [Corynebacterium appendicis]MDK8625689.1 hypothetical protein [Corynebacterium appendicis]
MMERNSAKQIPQVTPSELIRESLLTHNRFVVVEGESDRGVYRFWLGRQAQEDARINLQNIKVIPAERIIDVQDEAAESGVPSLGGCRGTVITTARIAWEQGSEGICGIVDLDFGLDEVFPNLLHTDYPALESYVFEADVLNQLNERHLKDQLPDGEVIVSAMAPVLSSLFHLKKANPQKPHLSCRIDRGFPAVSSSGNGDGLSRLNNFSIERTVEGDSWVIPDDLEFASSSDPRTFAYGHDIARVLVGAFSDELKGAKFKKVEQIESLLIDRLRDWSGIEREPLYVKLGQFAVSGNTGITG